MLSTGCIESAQTLRPLLGAKVVPVMLEALPLKEDFEEAVPVYQALTALATNPALAQRVAHVRPQLMAALEAVMHQKDIPDHVKEGIAGSLENGGHRHSHSNGSV